MRCLNPEKLRLLASPCIAVSLISRRGLRTCLLATATENPSILAAGSGRPKADEDGGIRFVYEPPRRFALGALRKRRLSPPTSAKPRIDLLVEGNPLSTSPARVEPLAAAARSDAAAALQVVLQRKALNDPGWKMPRIALLSLVLCDDPHIRDLNSRHRGKDSATDVLSFEMEDDLDRRVHLPLKLMGDLVMSLDTAERQAAERGHSLLDECRILLVHGLLHLAGHDHERGREAHEAMAAEERAVLAELGWKGKGLIAAADEEEGSAAQRGISDREHGTARGSGGEGQGRHGKGEGKAAARPSGGGITAGTGAGFLWHEVTREGGSGKVSTEEEAASRRGPKANTRRATQDASGSAAEAQGTAAMQQKQLTPSPSPSSSPPVKQQGREGGGGGSVGGGGRGSGGAGAPHGARGGPGAGRAVGRESSVGLTGPAASPGITRFNDIGSSVPPIPYAGASRLRLQVSARGTCGGRWSLGGGRYAASVLRCSCSAGGGAGDGGADGGTSMTAAAAATAAPVSADASRAFESADGDGVGSTSVPAAAAGGAASEASGVTAGYGTQRPRRRTREVAIVALDLDGTLLDSKSRILPSSTAVIRAAAAAGVIVVAATGKARPAALAAAASAGLAEPGLLVWPQGPGVFLQGLAVHGRGGVALSDAALPDSVVEAAYKYSAASRVPLCAFLGDTCATPDLTAEIRELHTTYYEPLAEVVPSAAALRTGPPVRKMLFMTDPGTVTNELLPYWTRQLEGSGAQVMQAVPNMLEIVPSGVNKWAGVRRLLDHLALPPSALMAVGDGGNDLEMVAGAGLGVAMGNAVPS
ncbi:hypothetical protein Vretifemale_15410, partial [Volvox reticuliferus]